MGGLAPGQNDPWQARIKPIIAELETATWSRLFATAYRQHRVRGAGRRLVREDAGLSRVATALCFQRGRCRPSHGRRHRLGAAVVPKCRSSFDRDHHASCAGGIAGGAGPEVLRFCRRYKEFHDDAASWDRVERIIARVEAGPLVVDTCFVVISLTVESPRRLYEDLYCVRGRAETHIKVWKRHLAADRASCSRASANQMHLFLHFGAYRLMRALRALMPRRSLWRRCQFDTMRLRLIKLADRIETLSKSIRLHLPRGSPDQAILAYALAKLPRLVI